MMWRQLPRLKDEYFLALQAAVQGQYLPSPSTSALSPGDAVNRELDAFSNRADAAMRRYQQKKGMRGR